MKDAMRLQKLREDLLPTPNVLVLQHQLQVLDFDVLFVEQIDKVRKKEEPLE